FASTEASLSVRGDAADNIAVAQVAWSNDQGESGVASGTSVWMVEDIPLRPGLNLLQFTATDLAGHATSKTLAVTFTPPDRTGPIIQISSPTSDRTYTSSSRSLQLSGTASDAEGTVTRVVWVGDRAGSGIARGTARWNIDGIQLFAGENNFTV